MSMYPIRGSLEVFWEGNTVDPVDLCYFDFTPIMSYNRFKNILDCLAFCPMREGVSIEDVS